MTKDKTFKIKYMGKEINPKNIIERHERYPNATETLIEYYANMKAKKVIDTLLKYSVVANLSITHFVIFCDRDIFKDFKGFDPMKDIDIKTLVEFDKNK